MQALSLWQRRRPVMLVDGDTFYTSDVVAQFRSVAPVRARPGSLPSLPVGVCRPLASPHGLSSGASAENPNWVRMGARRAQGRCFASKRHTTSPSSRT